MIRKNRTRAPLNFHHLRYFWLVARSGNLTQVANEQHVSQSSISAQIRQLEDTLGQRLFERQHRRLVLTAFGALVLHYAREIFELGDELLNAVEGEGEGRVRRLRIGSVSTLSRNFQETLLRPLIGRPAVQLVLQSGSLEDLLERMRGYELDVVLSSRAVPSKRGLDWRCLRIARQPISLVGPPRKQRQPFRFPDDARELPLLLPGPSSEIRMQVDALWDSLGMVPHVSAEVDDMAMLRLLARDGAGVAAVPPVVVKDELSEKKLAVYCHLPDIYETFYAITIRRRRRDPWIGELLRMAQRSALGVR
jgi:LysR family transcriptional activator of nhaA